MSAGLNTFGRSIPASYIVEINPRVIGAGSDNLQINGLVLSDSPLIPASAMLAGFSSAAAVADYFGAASEEAAVAVPYFQAYDNKQMTPSRLFFGLRAGTALAATLIGAKLTASLEQLQAITAGAFTLAANGTSVSVSALDLSAATSFSDVAVALAAAINGAGEATVAVAYHSTPGAFLVTTTATGAEVNLSAASPVVGDASTAGLLGLSNAAGAVASPGLAAMTAAENMNALLAKSQNWVTFTALDFDTEENWFSYTELAAWASANHGYVFIPWMTEADVLSPASAADPASLLLAGGYDNTASVYGGVAYAAFIMGCAAAIDWTRQNSTITFAFRSQAALAATVTDQTAADACKQKHCNYYGKFATRNDQFAFLYPGCLVASDYQYLDPLINAIWLNNRLQVALMDGLVANARTPYTERGYSMIRAWMQEPIAEALRNGVIEPGVTLSSAQKSQILQEAGEDIASDLFANGYFVQVLDPGATVRAQRGSPIISLWYAYGGAVQRLVVSSTALL